jgi:co-chaperonin GroES (HSP10)
MKTKKNFVIINDRALIYPDAESDKTSSGLYISPAIREKEKGILVRGGMRAIV